MFHARPNLQTHNRAQRHSAVAGAAYRLGLCLYDAHTERWHDYRKRKVGEEIVAAFTVAPEGAPDWATDPQQLWNRVEAAEKRKDAQVARDYRLPIPFGLRDEDAEHLAREMAQFIVTSLTTAVSVGLHRDAAEDALGALKPAELQGFHAHLYFPTRKILLWHESEGTGDDGESSTGMGDKLGILSNSRTSSGFVEQMNAHWASLANKYAKTLGLPADYDHRSYKRMGVDREPQLTLGRVATALERKGLRTKRGDALRVRIVKRLEFQVADPNEEMTRQHRAALADVYRERLAKAIPADYSYGGEQGASEGATNVRSPDLVPPDVMNTPPTPPYGSGVQYRPTPVAPDDPLRPRGPRMPVPGSLEARFIAARPHTAEAMLENEDHVYQATNLMRVIERLLGALKSVGKLILALVQERRREEGCQIDRQMEADDSRKQANAARRKADDWAQAHPLRISTARALGNSPGPRAWQAFLDEADAHQSVVVQLNGMARSHAERVIALQGEEAPLLAKQADKTKRLTDALESLHELGDLFIPQLIAAANAEERQLLRPSLPWTAAVNDDASASPELVQGEGRGDAEGNATADVKHRPRPKL